jgi:hypothetical protein
MNRLAPWAGVVSLMAAIVIPSWAAVQPANDVGSLDAVRASRSELRGGSQFHLTAHRLVVRSGLLARQPPRMKRPVPTRVRIGAIGVDAPVVPVGVQAGTTEIPRDVRAVGWYRFGGRLGVSGSTLLVAHVSAGAAGPGAFFRLRELQPGDRVLVNTGSGSGSVFRVVARRTYPKVVLPDRVFSRTGPAVLTLITCGGPFSETTGRYEDNVVVYAVPDR